MRLRITKSATCIIAALQLGGCIGSEHPVRIQGPIGMAVYIRGQFIDGRFSRQTICVIDLATKEGHLTTFDTPSALSATGVHWSFRDNEVIARGESPGGTGIWALDLTSGRARLVNEAVHVDSTHSVLSPLVYDTDVGSMARLRYDSTSIASWYSQVSIGQRSGLIYALRESVIRPWLDSLVHVLEDSNRSGRPVSLLSLIRRNITEDVTEVVALDSAGNVVSESNFGVAASLAAFDERAQGVPRQLIRTGISRGWALSPDERLVAICTDYIVWIDNISDSEIAWSPQVPDGLLASEPRFSRCGKWLAAIGTNEGGQVSEILLASGPDFLGFTRRFSLPEVTPYSICWTQDSKFILVSVNRKPAPMASGLLWVEVTTGRIEPLRGPFVVDGRRVEDLQMASDFDLR